MVWLRTARNGNDQVNDVLTTPVLVLNRLWQAVNICAGRRALLLLFTGHAEVVHEEEGTFWTFSFEEWCLQGRQRLHPRHVARVRSVSLEVSLPRVILLRVFDRLPARDVRYTRENVFRRDRHTCQYCGRRYDTRQLNIDHVTPRHRGGPTDWTNVVCSCRNCNATKGSRTPNEAGMPLLKEPRKPRWRPFLEDQFTQAYHQSWRHFLDLPGGRVDLGES